MGDRFHRPGIVPAAAATLAAIVVLVGAVVLLLSRCAPSPAPLAPAPRVSAPPAQASTASTSSAAVASNLDLKMTIRRAAARDKPLKPSNDDKPASRSTGGVSTADDQEEEIIIELSQAVTASAASGAIASASAPVAAPRDALPDHGRLGVALTTMPGVLAADLQLARVEVPPWLAGVPLEVGLDAVGNLEAGGLGVSMGGKAFALAGGWSRWDGREQGIAMGAGLRF